MSKCNRCEGEGEIDEVYTIGDDKYGDGLKECPDCEGTGKELHTKARNKILELQHAVNTVQDLLHEHHTESNCQCNQKYGTETMYSDGAGDMEICLNCFGADGCVY